jgi:RNA polymerase sigma factor (sigma-70 family)
MTKPPSGHLSSDAGGSVTALFSGLKDCDEAILAQIWQRFFPRMAGLARKTLSGLPKCGVDAEDVAQSAFVSFWKALDSGSGFAFGGRDDLWKLLGVITARKARKHVRRQLASKRGGGKTRAESELALPAETDNANFTLDQVIGEVAPPEFDLSCEEMLLLLDEAHRAVAVLRLQGYTSDEIASRLECSPRSVQRRLEEVREHWVRATED